MLLFEMKKEALPIGTILNRKEFGDLHWYDEQRSCPLHGPYLARVVFARDEKRSNGFCPECRRLQEEKVAKDRAAVMAQIEADRERRRIEDALGRACIPVLTGNSSKVCIDRGACHGKVQKNRPSHLE